MPHHGIRGHCRESIFGLKLWLRKGDVPIYDDKAQIVHQKMKFQSAVDR